MKSQHNPMLQTSPIEHTLPHLPQLVGSLDVSVHMPLPLQHARGNGQQTEPQSDVPFAHSHWHVSGLKI